MSNQRTSIGWIGCGRMGTAMARRLLEAGHAVAVTNRTRAKADALEAHGASVVQTPANLASCDVVFVMVSADPDVLEVVSGPEGVLSSGTTVPKVVVDCSTISEETSAAVRAACAQRGSRFLAAPVSGNPSVVAAGQLTMAVSGEREAFDLVRPLLLEIGRSATYAGPGEVARLVKICHNMLLGVILQSMTEVAVLGEARGVPRSALLAFVNDSVVGSTFTRYKTPALVDLDFAPTFTTTLLRKDFDLGMAAARASGVPMPLAALCTELIASAIGAGYGDSDFASMLAEEARRAGVTLDVDDARVDDGLGASEGHASEASR